MSDRLCTLRAICGLVSLGRLNWAIDVLRQHLAVPIIKSWLCYYGKILLCLTGESGPGLPSGSSFLGIQLGLCRGFSGHPCSYT
jgi:hypothetical protein